MRRPSLRGALVATAVVAASGALVSSVLAEQKLVAPYHGLAKTQMTRPATKVEKGEVVTTILVKNMEKEPLAGFKVDENWYDKAGNPVGGGRFRQRTPIQPGEVIVVTIRTPRTPSLYQNRLFFTHAYGDVKQEIVPKLVPTKPAS